MTKREIEKEWEALFKTKRKLWEGVVVWRIDSPSKMFFFCSIAGTKMLENLEIYFFIIYVNMYYFWFKFDTTD